MSLSLKTTNKRTFGLVLPNEKDIGQHSDKCRHALLPFYFYFFTRKIYILLYGRNATINHLYFKEDNMNKIMIDDLNLMKNQADDFINAIDQCFRSSKIPTTEAEVLDLTILISAKENLSYVKGLFDARIKNYLSEDDEVRMKTLMSALKIYTELSKYF